MKCRQERQRFCIANVFQLPGARLAYPENFCVNEVISWSISKVPGAKGVLFDNQGCKYNPVESARREGYTDHASHSGKGHAYLRHTRAWESSSSYKGHR